MPKVLRALEEEHVAMGKLLDALERQLAVLEQGRVPDYDIIQGVMDYCLDYPDLHHHPKEDLVFERLAARDPAAAETVGDLLGEHAALGEGTRRFAAAIGNVLLEAEVPRDTLLGLARDFLGRYRHHIAMEDQRFFPAARTALTAEDWRAIEDQLTEGNDPLFGSRPDRRFKALREEILRWDQGGPQAEP